MAFKELTLTDTESLALTVAFHIFVAERVRVTNLRLYADPISEREWLSAPNPEEQKQRIARQIRVYADEGHWVEINFWGFKSRTPNGTKSDWHFESIYFGREGIPRVAEYKFFSNTGLSTNEFPDCTRMARVINGYNVPAFKEVLSPSEALSLP